MTVVFDYSSDLFVSPWQTKEPPSLWLFFWLFLLLLLMKEEIKD